ncbi:MAG: ArsC family transcriptional regulator [Firmicutes bacterium HGW-Firmicutes-8]|nr:MAG: ArsC family transcriptional regulator [Firmicutes bacterium HGW-Firmicutes-8]
MNIQIFGVKKCFNTKKAERYFKERRIKYQFIDLTIIGLSRGELKSVKAAVGLNNLIDSESKDYKRLYMDRISGINVREEMLLNNPSLYKTPVIRNGKQATVGYQPDIWNSWLN